MNLLNLVSLISQGVGYPKTSGTFRQSLLKILIIVYYVILGGDCQVFFFTVFTLSCPARARGLKRLDAQLREESQFVIQLTNRGHP